MAFHDTNYTIFPLTGGTYTTGQLGNGLTASCVHEVYCISAGTISITALGGGTVTMPMVSGQSIKVLLGKAVITSGMYAGFKAKFNNSVTTTVTWPS
jgi:hypothetical protein